MADPIIYLGNIDNLNPEDTDIIEQGDNELRTLKLSIKSSFPNLTVPLNYGPADLNALNNRINTKFITGETDNYIDFTTKISIPYLPKLSGAVGYDLNYLSIDNEGSLNRLSPFSPLGSIIISPLFESEIEGLYPNTFMLCAGQLLPEDSELFKLLELSIGSGYTIPDLFYLRKTIRAQNSTRLPLAEVAGMAAMTDDVKFETSSYSHDHVDGLNANRHTHIFNYKYNAPFNAAIGTSFDGYGSVRRLNHASAGATFTSGPKNSDNTTWTLASFSHGHAIFWSSNIATRSAEIGYNHFIRIN